jgi:amino acid adenylation domain-containing protein/non-ribosomal peptide synthase protein (TIGR01720 family)
MLVEWNATAAELPRDRCVHHLIEDQAERTPDAVALTFQGQTLTYRELNRRANQVAHHLQKRGVQPEDRVGLAVERSPDMVVGLLGILKAGACYVPLDSTYPPERLTFMLQDAEIHTLLTQERPLARLPVHRSPPPGASGLAYPACQGQARPLAPRADFQVIRLDTDWPILAQERDDNPTSEVGPANAAYVIFTSGSTGHPKGVLVEHHSLLNVVLGQIRAFGVRPKNRVLQFVAMGFDAAQPEILRVLVAGATLCLNRPEDLLPGRPLLKVLRRQRITMMSTLPSVLSALPLDEELPELRTLIIGGEAFPAELAVHWGKGRRLFNGYGPTEATVCATTATGWDLSKPPPLGRPIANVQVYVLDEDWQPVPVGVPGELHIGGAGVARGYLHQPELTAIKFIPDPFNGQPGARLYKTGDLVCWRPDGQLEFLGRIDNQVKIRGFRIELGEIETVLGQHPEVRQGVVLAREDRPGDKRLVGYVVPRSQPGPSAGELRSYLKDRLPEYMVPSVFVFLDKMPLTANHKADRKALAAPASRRPEMAGAYVPPQTALEEQVAGIWAEVLRLDRVGVHDNFFELGGNSLQATQVVSRLRSTFALDLSLRSIFEDPTVAGLAQGIDELQRGAPSCQAGLLLRGPDRNVRPAGQECPAHGIILSFAQQRLWFIDQLEPGNPLYNLPAAIRFRGRLDVSALEGSLREIVRRHEVLRTTFTSRDGQAVQVIAPDAALVLPLIDLRDLPEDQRERRAMELARAEVQRPFNLTTGPVIRPALLRLHGEEHILLPTMHHIVADAWSLAVFTRELAALYEAFTQGHPSPLPELAIQYADFALWQRQWLQGDVRQAQLNYWKNRLANLPAALELPTDRPRPTVQTFHGDVYPFALPLELSQALEQLSRKEGVTLYMTLLAAFQILLARYSGQDDVVVGSPIAGRSRPETEGLIGFFINILVLRTDLSGDPTVGELLGRVREVCLGAFAHQDLPFEKLVDELNLPRDLSRSPVFQAAFILQNAPLPTFTLPGLTLTPVDVEQGTAKADISLSMTETPQGLTARLVYNTDLFDASTVARMARHFQALLDNLVVSPEQPLSRLGLLPEAERQQVLVEWNDTAAAFPLDRCVHELFEEQVKQRPDAVAVVFQGQSLTYAELDRRANQLAHHLRGLGVGLETKVALYLERSLEMVIALAAVHKAGAAYLPLDLSAPRDRLAFMLRDAEVQVLLTQQHLRSQCSPHTPCAVLPHAERADYSILCLDSDWPAIAQAPTDTPRSGVGPDNLAYIIYTSGSTGQPKGVLVEHHGLTNIVCCHIRDLDVRPETHACPFLSLHFDAAQSEFWRALAAGATLYLATAEILLPSPALVSFLRDQAINLIALPTSVLTAMPADADLPELRNLIVGGEALSMEAAARWYKGRRFFNGYGPTETTVCSTIAANWDITRPPPLGKPVANTQVYVLDEHLQPLPVGVPGELYIGGVGVARGYLHQPELTAAKFLADSFSAGPGARLYRTGDQVRWRPDGTLEFLGRIDDQIKIRGFRIELGEIESVLGQHPAIRDRAVIAREDGPGGKRLVGYVVTQQTPPPSIADLRGFLRAKLSEHMVPATFVFLDTLPRKANGKVDRKALPAPAADGTDLENYVAPRNRTEEILAGIWAAVLKRERVGIDHNFFELGGESILSIQIIARANQAGLRLTAKDLFQHQTIAELAQVVENAGGVSAEQGLVTGPVPLTPIQHWLLEQDYSKTTFRIQMLFLEVERSSQLDLWVQAARHVLEHHDALRLRFERDGSGWRQVNAGREALAKAFIRLATPAGPRRSRVEDEVLLRLIADWDLASGPLVRIAFFEDSGPESDDMLLITLHPLVGDLASLRIIAEDLLTAYQHLRRGQPVSLPAKTGSYRQWSQRLMALAQAGEVRAELTYWLDPARAEVHPLPVDQPATVPSAGPPVVGVALTEDETRALRDQTHRAYRMRITEILLTALVQATTAWTGRPSLLVDVEEPGRDEADLEVARTVGCFEVRFPVQIDLSAASGPGLALLAVKEQLRGVPGRGVGYGLLRYLSGDETIAGPLRAAAAKVSFRYLGTVDEGWPVRPSLTMVPSRPSAGLLHLESYIQRDCLETTWTYDAERLKRRTVERLAQNFLRALRELITHCQSPGAGGLSASDFPAADLSQDDLNELLSQIDPDGEGETQ